MSKTQIPTGGIADDAVTATKTTVGGITMAEQGISQLVSVDLQKAEELVA